MTRHGESVHFVRPDRVVRTGVLTPIVGYQPQRDVISVTQEFATGPASGMQLHGLGNMMLLGLGAPGPVMRFWLRLKAAIAERRAAVRATISQRKAERMMLTDAAHGSIPGAPMAPIVAQAPMTVPPMPSIPAQQQFAYMLAYRGIPMRAEVYPQRRWNTYFYAG